MRLGPFLTKIQAASIHQSALRVLSEVGVRVEHSEVRSRLTIAGGTRDEANELVRFPPQAVEKLIAEATKKPLSNDSPRVSAGVGIYQCQYLDPHSSGLRSFDEDTTARMIGLARSLPRVAGIIMLGTPFIPDGIPAPYLPLAEKLYAWKYGVTEVGTIQLTGLCQPILDLYAWRANQLGKPLGDVCRARGFMLSPLRLARSECEQLLFFDERGVRMSFGSMQSQGGSAPVTLAGALVLFLAECIFLFLLNQCFWGDAEFSLSGSVPTMEPRTGLSRFGRPEMQRANIARADLARFYGCSATGHTGLTDAMLPSFEAGVQKAMGALITALAVGSGYVEAGLIAMDEVLSPVQMVLDDELTGALQALLADPLVDDLECAVEEIRAVGHSGHHLGTELTASRYKTDLFQPSTWSMHSLGSWESMHRAIDVDKARGIVSDFEHTFTPETYLTAGQEKELRAIIDRAVKASLANT